MNVAPEILSGLNELLRHELTVINQYFLHARMLRNWGYEKLNAHICKCSIVAMKNADALIERIFLLEGLPNLQNLGKLLVGEEVSEVLNCDLQAASAQQAEQKRVIELCEQQQDFVSRLLIEKQLNNNEEHIDWLQTQLELIDALGYQNYLQQSACEHS